MTSKRLLTLTYHFPPSAASGVFRLLGFVEHLPKFGWETTVVAPPRMPLEPTDEGLLKKVPPQTDVRYVPYPTGRLSRLLRRGLGHAPWLPRAYAACSELISQHRPTAVLTSGPPHCLHLLGLFLQRFHRLPWVADFRDPWHTPRHSGLNGRIIEWEERAVFHCADLVIANAPLAKAAFDQAHPRHRGKIVTITNGFDSCPESPAPPQTTEPLRIVHVGEIYHGRDPRPYLDALYALSKDKAAGAQFQTRFIGRIDSNFDLEKEIRQRDLSQAVTICGQVPYQTALNEIQQADIVLLLDTPGRKYGVPAKLYEYFGAGKPILSLAEPDGDVVSILQQSSILHRAAPPRDTDAIRAALLELQSAIARGQQIVADPGALIRFTRRSLAQELAKQLDTLTA